MQSILLAHFYRAGKLNNNSTFRDQQILLLFLSQHFQFTRDHQCKRQVIQESVTSRLLRQRSQHLPRTRANRAILTYIPFSACLKYAARGSESNSGLKHNQHHIIKPSLQCFNRGPKEQLFCIFTFQKIPLGM